MSQWPNASQGLHIQNSGQATNQNTSLMLQYLQQQNAANPSFPSLSASVAAPIPQASVSFPPSQGSQMGVPSHARGVGSTLQMVQSATSGPQGMPHLVSGGQILPGVTGSVPSLTEGPSMMQGVERQPSPQIVSNMNMQQRIQAGNAHSMYSTPAVSASTTQVLTVQNSSQFMQNSMVPQVQQIYSSGNFEQNEMLLTNSDTWKHLGPGASQTMHVPSATQGLYDMKQSGPVEAVAPQPSQSDMIGNATFAHSAVSGSFLQGNVSSSGISNQGRQQISDDPKHGASGWGVQPTGSNWSDTPASSSQFPTSPPPSGPGSLPSSNQNTAQWTADTRSAQSPEMPYSTPPKEPTGWGNVSPAPQGSSQQRLGTDGWGSSGQGQGTSGWSKDSQQSSSWSTGSKAVTGHANPHYQHVMNQKNDVEDMGGSNRFNQQEKQPNRNPGTNVFEETSVLPGGYPTPGGHTLPSKHKEGSPAAEGVSYSAMSEAGSYGINTGNEYDTSSYGGGYSPLGGGYGEVVAPVGQPGGKFVLMPENRTQASPENCDRVLIKQCFEEEDDLSPHEVNAYKKLNRMREYAQPDWSQFESSNDKQVPRTYPGRGARGGGRRVQGRGSVINHSMALPTVPAHPSAKGQYPTKQKYSPRN